MLIWSSGMLSLFFRLPSAASAGVASAAPPPRVAFSRNPACRGYGGVGRTCGSSGAGGFRFVATPFSFG